MQSSLFDAPRETFVAAPTAITLRPYQRACVDAVYAHLRAHDDNPCAVIPTAGGKTPIMATICRDAVCQWQGRVLILAHVKELLEQAADKLRTICRGVPVGVYSAGLGRRDTNRPITVAGIQSVWRHACDLDPFDLVLVDEAHLIAPEGDGMYRQFLADAKTVNRQLRIVGFTATPFRMKSGPICSPAGFLNRICYEVGVRELVVDGYLSPLVSKAAATKFDTAALNIRGGEFIAEQVETLFDDDGLTRAACAEILALTADRKSCLIFAAGVKHAIHVAATLDSLAGAGSAAVVTGDTPDADRSRILARFRRGELKYLVNVNVLTTGFDAPNIDAVCLLRPTNSPGLYYQMVGRGFRLSPETGKRDCLVLDFGGNVVRHGPVDKIRVEDPAAKGNGEPPAKECPDCHALIAAGFGVCPHCGHEFPPPERAKHDATATKAAVLSGEVSVERFPVLSTWYSVHKKRNAEDDAPRSMRVDYQINDCGETKSEWICFEHAGFARQKAVAWWKARSLDPIPDSAHDAVNAAVAGAVAEPSEITVRMVSGEQFERIVDWKLGPIPTAVEPLDESGEMPSPRRNFDDDIPF